VHERGLVRASDRHERGLVRASDRHERGLVRASDRHERGRGCLGLRDHTYGCLACGVVEDRYGFIYAPLMTSVCIPPPPFSVPSLSASHNRKAQPPLPPFAP
jgi:hypothetical protein